MPAPHTFHIVHTDTDDQVTKLEHVGQSPVRINAGFFVLRREIFDYMRPGEELVLEPFQRLIDEGELLAIPVRRVLAATWTPSRTRSNSTRSSPGEPPWQVWARSSQSWP